MISLRWSAMLCGILFMACNDAAPPGARSAPDTSAAIQPPAPPANWTGTWEREAWASGATLDIDARSGDTLHVQLVAVNGGHTGELDEHIVPKDRSAEYQYQDASDGCLVRFRLLGDTAIDVEQVKGTCGSGAGVSFSGRYFRRNTGRITSSKPKETLLTLGVFSAADQEAAFRALTGMDYELFLNNTQLTSEDEDLDGLGATVTSAAVRGLFTSMEQIIMIDSRNQVWAATIDGDTVRYYTNSRTFTDRLPRTIEAWREGFADKPVVFTSRTDVKR